MFRSIHTQLTANGGTDSEADIAAGVANAIFNTGAKYLNGISDGRAQREFQNRFDQRAPSDWDASDNMVDWLIAYDGGTQEFLTTLVARLRDVLSKPA